VSEEHAVHLLPAYLELRKALQCASSCVEKELLPARLDERAWPEAIHDGRRSAGTEEGHLDLRLRSSDGNKDDEKKAQLPCR